MGNRRSPCCDKNLVKRGPWSPAEDLKLITFIQKYGHDNWRALPRQAGLMRCGKSCRLRWVNYLRPDVKRGDYSQEELETIMKLHEALGNKWSMIASHLPGRTDNEIKNLWNTHLKKRLACKKTSESASDMQEFQGATMKEPEQNLVKQGSNELVGIIKNPNQSSSSAAAVSSVQLNNFNASHMDAYKPDQQMSSSLFKHFEPYNVDKPSEEANQLNSLMVKTPFEADCDFWKILDNIPIKLNEVQLGQDHDIHNQTLRQENVHYAETIKCLHGMENEFGFDATNEANKDQCVHKNIASTESGIDPHSFGYDEMTMPEFDYDIDLGYVQWYSSWPQNPSL